MCPSRISAASPPPQPNSPSNDDQLLWNIIDYDYYDDDETEEWGDDESEEYTLIPLYTWTQCSEPRLSHGTIVRIALGLVAMVIFVAVVMFLAGCSYNEVVYRKNISLALLRNAQAQLMPTQASNGGVLAAGLEGITVDKAVEFAYEELSKATHDFRLASNGGVLAAGLEGITVDKAVEFAYEELSKATHDFRLGNKIGQGGFGSVYYAELRGQKAAIKKMGMQASKEFIAELKVLTHVHHLNLVRLIGYCTFERSHFLVYEYIENGNLSEHLHGSGRDPLPWSIRLHIALDSARGLEYMHEYTVPIFIHCDIKSANILIDKNFNGKVGDFGLTRLTEVRSRSRLMGTFGYMAPEYAQYGDVSPKVDVYAFGVVLYELISAKTAIIRASSTAEPKGLIALFDEVLSEADPKDDMVKVIDPRLGDNYPLDSVYKVAQLAKACTHAIPHQRPSMRSIVVALMTLVLSTED
ncbi:hypothetical protein SSX86_006664 [Deinandra increscens subsp. villosa]|uniref:non-specific serine/threonine protein kinase n=1 Tax=Deinandra increscens subsp. villosa TaxID=3103831 RepID=A0AAP0H705_9ASTR